MTDSIFFIFFFLLKNASLSLFRVRKHKGVRISRTNSLSSLGIDSEFPLDLLACDTFLLGPDRDGKMRIAVRLPIF